MILNRVGSDRHEADPAGRARPTGRARAGRGAPGRRESRRRRGTWASSRPPSAPPRRVRSVARLGDLLAAVGRPGRGARGSPRDAPPLAGRRRRTPTPPLAEGASGSVPSSRWPVAPRSRSATPSTPSCWPRPGREVVAVDPLRDERCPPAPPRSSSAAGSPRCTRAALSANERAARAGRRARPVGGARSWPSAPGCSTWPANWTGQPMCGVLDADRADDPPADARLPGGDRALRCARPGGHRPCTAHEFHRTVVEPGAGASPRLVDGLAARGIRRRAGCTRPTCTCTGLRTRRSPRGWCAGPAGTRGSPHESAGGGGRRARRPRVGDRQGSTGDARRGRRPRAGARRGRAGPGRGDSAGSRPGRAAAQGGLHDGRRPRHHPAPRSRLGRRGSRGASRLRRRRDNGRVRDDRRPQRLLDFHLPRHDGTSQPARRRRGDRAGHHGHAGPRRPCGHGAVRRHRDARARFR